MNPNTRNLHDLGQCLWLDNITRELLTSGALERYIGALAVRDIRTDKPRFLRFATAQTAGTVALTLKASLNHESRSSMSIFTLLPSEPPTESAGKAAPETASERARLMAEFAIAYDGRHYQHDGKRYDRLADAVRYASYRTNSIEPGVCERRLSHQRPAFQQSVGADLHAARPER